jgi:hypothetical protein
MTKRVFNCNSGSSYFIKDENNWVLLEGWQNIFLCPLQNGTTEIHLEIFATKPNLQHRIARLEYGQDFFAGIHL